MLLHHICGTKSYQDLRTVDQHVYLTFQAAARALNLLASDEQWDACLTECLSFQSPVQLRKLFTTILLFCIPSNPLSLWNILKEYLAEDYIHRGSSELDPSVLLESSLKECYDNCLLDINDLLAACGRSVTYFEGLYLPTNDTRNNGFSSAPPLLREHLILNAAASTCPDPSLLPFNDNQKALFDMVLELTELPHSTQPRIIFIDGPGSTGKNFLFNNTSLCTS